MYKVFFIQAQNRTVRVNFRFFCPCLMLCALFSVYVHGVGKLLIESFFHCFTLVCSVIGCLIVSRS